MTEASTHHALVQCPMMQRQESFPQTEPHTPLLAKKFANVSTLTNAPGVMSVHLPMYAGMQDARVCTQAKGAPRRYELQRAHTLTHSHLEKEPHGFRYKFSQTNSPLRSETTSQRPQLELREQVCTPLIHLHFRRELTNHPDKAWVSWLLNAIHQGVTIGYDGPRGPMIAKNLPSAYQHEQILTQEIQKECSAGRLLGPFTSLPIENLKCSGVGVVPKKNGKWRMIHHLSAPEGQSINDFISKEDFSLHYSSVDDATSILSELGKGALLAKVDLKAAFRMVPVHKTDWELLGIHWKQAYYVDTCLPFGLRSAPYLFNQFAEALQWILQNNHGLQWLIHYLDDYLIFGQADSLECNQFLAKFLKVCEFLGIPVAMDKVDGPATVLTFLGLELDSVLQQIRLPAEKLQAILKELEDWQQRKKATKRQLLSLIGKLSFAARAVPAGRLFTRRLITLTIKVKQLHHHIRLNDEAQADILWWKTFLPSWNGTALFVDRTATAAIDLEIYTDASGTHGCGAYYRGAWFHYDWQPTQQLSRHISIQWQELFAILAAALTWGHHWQQKKILFYCDNLPIVQAWEGKASKQPRIMSLLRKLFLAAAKNHFTVTMKHLPGKTNNIADALSRKQFNRFFFLAPQAQQMATPTPGSLREL